MLRKLCERGLFQNVGGVVSPLMSREDYYARQSEEFVAETFGGSLPGFIAAFTQRKKLTAEEAAEIRKLIEGM